MITTFLFPLALAAPSCLEHDQALVVQQNLKKQGYSLMVICHDLKKIYHCSAEFYTKTKSFTAYGASAEEAIIKAAAGVK